MPPLRLASLLLFPRSQGRGFLWHFSPAFLSDFHCHFHADFRCDTDRFAFRLLYQWLRIYFPPRLSAPFPSQKSSCTTGFGAIIGTVLYTVLCTALWAVLCLVLSTVPSAFSINALVPLLRPDLLLLFSRTKQHKPAQRVCPPLAA
jgi:hypothetical protein